MDNYDHITSKHYAAYRPPLHQLILEKVLDREQRFEHGLDIGCGTGYSSIALAKYCKNVVGIEPSSEMLKDSISHPKVEYQDYDGKILNFPDQFFDIITFAGSLYYAKSQRLLDEVIRISKDQTIIITYDFEVLLNDLYKKLEIDRVINRGIYNHFEDFSGLDKKQVDLLDQVKDQVIIEVLPSDLGHLLLSVKDVYKILLNEYGDEDPYQKLLMNLKDLSNGNPYKLKANIHYTVYQHNLLI